MFRALLTAISIVVLIPPAVSVLGGWFPNLPSVGPLAAVINTGLPWLLITAGIATGLSGLAVALGGNKASVLLVLSLAVLLGAVGIAYRFTTFAQANGATYDLVRAIDGFPPIPEPHTEVVFATVDGVELKAGLWLPADAPAAAPKSKPAAVFVHGGAFIGGFLGTRPTLLGALARAGVVGIDIEYRLAPPPRWDQAPGDVLCALAWLPNAPELAMVDPQRVVLVGESAGGSLALMAGYAAGTDEIASSCREQGPPLVPAGVFAVAPTADLEGIWNDKSVYEFDGGRFPEAYIGGTPAEFPDRYAAAEPFRLLRPDLPPTVILTGEIDRMVHLERSTELAERIRAAGAQCELLVAPFAGHGFDGEPNSFGAQLAEAIIPQFVLRVPPAPALPAVPTSS
jgi:acetyl esterase/lipase